MEIVHAYKPKKIVIPVPSFYGYEHAAKASGAEVSFVSMPWEDSHLVVTTLFASLTEGTELLFLANPNNPTGTLLAREKLKEIFSHCKEKGIVVVLDECFIEFCHAGHSMVSELSDYPNLLIVRAFTKIFAIPGAAWLSDRSGRSAWSDSGAASRMECVCFCTKGRCGKEVGAYHLMQAENPVWICAFEFFEEEMQEESGTELVENADVIARNGMLKKAEDRYET